MRTREQIRNPANGHPLGQWAHPTLLDGKVPAELLLRWAIIGASLGVPIQKYQSLAFDVAGKAQTVNKAELKNRKFASVLWAAPGAVAVGGESPGTSVQSWSLRYRAEGPVLRTERTEFIQEGMFVSNFDALSDLQKSICQTLDEGPKLWLEPGTEALGSCLERVAIVEPTLGNHVSSAFLPLPNWFVPGCRLEVPGLTPAVVEADARATGLPVVADAQQVWIPLVLHSQVGQGWLAASDGSLTFVCEHWAALEEYERQARFRAALECTFLLAHRAQGPTKDGLRSWIEHAAAHRSAIGGARVPINGPDRARSCLRARSDAPLPLGLLVETEAVRASSIATSARRAIPVIERHFQHQTWRWKDPEVRDLWILPHGLGSDSGSLPHTQYGEVMGRAEAGPFDVERRGGWYWRVEWDSRHDGRPGFLLHVGNVSTTAGFVRGAHELVRYLATAAALVRDRDPRARIETLWLNAPAPT